MLSHSVFLAGHPKSLVFFKQWFQDLVFVKILEHFCKHFGVQNPCFLEYFCVERPAGVNFIKLWRTAKSERRKFAKKWQLRNSLKFFFVNFIKQFSNCWLSPERDYLGFLACFLRALLNFFSSVSLNNFLMTDFCQKKIGLNFLLSRYRFE